MNSADSAIGEVRGSSAATSHQAVGFIMEMSSELDLEG
jgi:hypothetical protein